MTTEIKKVWFDGEKVVTQNIPEYKFYLPPTPVGYWVLYAETSPQTMFSMYHKPTDEQIANTERLLGWTWKDAK